MLCTYSEQHTCWCLKRDTVPHRGKGSSTGDAGNLCRCHHLIPGQRAYQQVRHAYPSPKLLHRIQAQPEASEAPELGFYKVQHSHSWPFCCPATHRFYRVILASGPQRSLFPLAGFGFLADKPFPRERGGFPALGCSDRCQVL